MSMTFRPPVTRTERKIDAFQTLAQGWHYGSGGPIEVVVAKRAKDIFARLLDVGLTRTDAFPDEDGSILLTAYRGSKPNNHYVGITISPDQTYSLVHEVGDNDDDAELIEGLSLDDLKVQLAEISAEIWGTSGSSIPASTSASGSGLTTPHSSARLMVGCPFSSGPALRPLAAA